MRVAVVASPYIPVPPLLYGGVELVIYYLIKGLKEAGHTPILLGPADSKVDCEIVPIVDKAVNFPTLKKDFKAHRKLVLAIERKTRTLLNDLKPRIDIIHSHGFDLSNITDFPILTTLHGKIDLDELQYFIKRKHIPCISISKNQQIACPELNFIANIYNGEDPAEFPVVTEPDNYVCFLGRFDREKNPHLAVQLAINLGIKIKLAGKIDFQGEEYIKDELAKYFDHPLVEYLGELNFDQKIKMLSKAKCNLHPTGFREPFGLTVLEAAYCGTPTLAIARGSMPELIEDGKSGILIEDFVEGYRQMDQCFAMNRAYIARRARKLFNYQKMTREYLKAYRKTILFFGQSL